MDPPTGDNAAGGTKRPPQEAITPISKSRLRLRRAKLEKEEEFATEEERFLNAWRKKGDLSRACKLARDFCGTGMYNWGCFGNGFVYGPSSDYDDDSDGFSFFRKEPPTLAELDGSHDILICAGLYDSQAHQGGKISRTMQNSSVKFSVKDSVLYGEVKVQPSRVFDLNSHRAPVYQAPLTSWWERQVQTSFKFERDIPLTFEEKLSDNRDLRYAVSCRVVEHEFPDDPVFEVNASIAIIDHDGSLPWIPIENTYWLNSMTFGDEYTDYMREQLLAQSNWRADASWLCNHKGLPAKVVSIIRSYTTYQPKPSWSFQKGDLMLVLAVDFFPPGPTTHREVPPDYAPADFKHQGGMSDHFFKTVYIARRSSDQDASAS